MNTKAEELGGTWNFIEKTESSLRFHEHFINPYGLSYWISALRIVPPGIGWTLKTLQPGSIRLIPPTYW
jgi:hypothetical protein